MSCIKNKITKLASYTRSTINRHPFVVIYHYLSLKSFYRAANAVFSKIGRAASEEVTLQSIKR